MVNGPTTFKSITVKPYMRNETTIRMESKDHILPPVPTPEPRRRGRPPGARNKARTGVYLTRKEEGNMELAVKLRNNGVINTPGNPFEELNAIKVNDLIGQSIFVFKLYI